MLYLETILTTIKGTSIVAQDSASTALKKLCKSEAELIVDLHPKLLEVFVSILQQNTYHRIFIYDTLAEFVETIQDQTFLETVFSQVMPILLQSLQSVKIHDGAFVPLFECICSMTRAGGHMIQPYADTLLTHILGIAEEITRVILLNSPRGKSKDKVRLEYELNNNIMRCFDFIGILSEAIPDKMSSLASANRLPGLMFTYVETDNLMLKQIVYSVIGDLIATMDKTLFESQIDRVISLLVEDSRVLSASLDPGKSYLSIATNALYALSEIVEKMPNHIDPAKVLLKLVKIYENPKVPSP